MLALGPDEIASEIVALGFPKYRGQQLWQWLHKQRVADFAAMNNLPAALREALARGRRVWGFAEREHLVSGDGLTEKWLYASDGSPIETALIREIRGKRRTVCVSCMCGCPVGCVFCATGQGGFTRNLRAAEIVEQVYRADARCREHDHEGLTNVVYMGMGEPLLNYDEVIRSATILSHPQGFNLGHRHITISTMGVIPRILQLAEEHPAFRLALSLHAPEQKLRERLIPLAKKYPLGELMDSLAAFAARTSRKLMIEYCLLREVNDRLEDAARLKALLRGLPVQVNLIPLNPTPSCPYKTPEPRRVRAFQDALGDLPVTLREEKGRDIDAACGQLRARELGR